MGAKETDRVWVQVVPSGSGVFEVLETEEGKLHCGYVTADPESAWAAIVLKNMCSFTGGAVDWKEMPYGSFFHSVFSMLPEHVDLLWLDGAPLPLSAKGVAFAAKTEPEWGERSVAEWGEALVERMADGIQDDTLRERLREVYLGGMRLAVDRMSPVEERN